MREKKHSMKKSVLLLFLAFLLFLFGYNNRPCAAGSYENCWTKCKEIFSDDFCKEACKQYRWKAFAFDKRGIYFYNTKSVTLETHVNLATKKSEKWAKVWIKMIPTEKGREELVKEFGEKYEKAGFYLELCEIDCTEIEFHRLKGILYSSDGEIIEETGRLFFSPWKQVVPRKVIEVLFDEVCSKM